jgi:hypothetical protein
MPIAFGTQRGDHAHSIYRPGLAALNSGYEHWRRQANRAINFAAAPSLITIANCILARVAPT